MFYLDCSYIDVSRRDWALHYCYMLPGTKSMDVLTAALMYLVGTGCSSGVLAKWAWIRAPATHFLGAQFLTTQTISTPPAATLPQHLPTPFSVIVLSAQYLFQWGPIWVRPLHSQARSEG